jgi:metallo-beta-lactamase class B
MRFTTKTRRHKGTLRFLCVFVSLWLLTSTLRPFALGQATVQQHIDAAKKIAGTEWATAANYFCAETQVTTSATDPEVEPAKVFDNLYYFGDKATIAYAINTSDGIILIDAGYADKVESILIAGMKKVGLDPAKIKYVIITHGHADHFGGAAYLQEHYGAHVIVSEVDWQMMQPGGRGAAPPKRDMVAVEGQQIRLGDVTVTPVLTPGHTPGSIALVFPVKDGTQTHTAGLFGGTILRAGNASPEALQQSLRSLDHFAEIAKQMKVDVEVQNHPLYDNTFEKTSALQARRPGAPHPFVVGEPSYARFVNVMSECAKAGAARRQ